MAAQGQVGTTGAAVLRGQYLLSDRKRALQGDRKRVLEGHGRGSFAYELRPASTVAAACIHTADIQSAVHAHLGKGVWHAADHVR